MSDNDFHFKANNCRYWQNNLNLSLWELAYIENRMCITTKLCIAVIDINNTSSKLAQTAERIEWLRFGIFWKMHQGLNSPLNSSTASFRACWLLHAKWYCRLKKSLGISKQHNDIQVLLASINSKQLTMWFGHENILENVLQYWKSYL